VFPGLVRVDEAVDLAVAVAGVIGDDGLQVVGSVGR
jgi:hypothetical protein